jgi:chromosome segregation ATPase
MINLEQIKLLETKVSQTIDYVERLSGENAALRQQEAELRQQETELNKKLTSYQKRIDELEILIVRFKEDQSRIEDGILSALNRLNQFEEAIEKSLTIGDKNAGAKSAKTPKQSHANAEKGSDGEPDVSGGTDEKICFEIPMSATADKSADAPQPDNAADLPDPLTETEADDSVDGELDIF